MARIILGVTGSAAAREAVTLAEKLTRNGYLVDVVLTEAATHFVEKDRLEAATGRPVHVSLYENGAQGEGLHIALAREADLAVVAPATANTIARIAAGWKTSAMSFSVPSTRDTVGRHKVDAAAARIAQIDPRCEVRTYKTFYLHARLIVSGGHPWRKLLLLSFVTKHRKRDPRKGRPFADLFFALYRLCR